MLQMPRRWMSLRSAILVRTLKLLSAVAMP